MPRVFIHIGPAKTGSTSIQHTMFTNREYLYKHGIRYFCDDKKIMSSAQIAAIFSGFSERRLKRKYIDGLVGFQDIRKRLKRRLDEVIGHGDFDKLIISSEALPQMKSSEVQSMKMYFDDHGLDANIICYARHPYQSASSQYQNAVLGGETNAQIGSGFKFMFEKYVDTFGRAEVQIREFSPSTFVGGQLISDFFDAIGEPEIDMDAIDIRTMNSSASAEAIALLEALNPHLEWVWDDAEGKMPRAMRLRRLLGDLPGRQFKLAPEQALEVYRDAEADIQWLRSVLGYDIFPEPEINDEPEDIGPVWDDEVLAALGLKVNEVLLENQQLKSKIQFMRARMMAKDGDQETARDLLWRSVELDPANEPAAKMLKKYLTV